MAYKVPFKIIRHVYTADDTYTPTAGMRYCDVECVGGGGGSGGTAAIDTASRCSMSIGGGGGGYARKIIDASTVGASKSITIGLGGTAGAAGNNSGGTGGTSSFGAILSATGGVGGTGGAQAVTLGVCGVIGGSGSGGDVNVDGSCSSYGYFNFSFAHFGSYGGSSVYGSGGRGLVLDRGESGRGVGAGAGGCESYVNPTAATAGVAGNDGFVVVTEFIF